MQANFSEQLYQFLTDYISTHQESPSYATMTEAMGISPRSKSLITRSLRKLAKERKLQLTKKGRQVVITLTSHALPLLGRISAGQPIEAITDLQFIDLEQLTVGINRFVLQVKGTSMIDEGILDGDLIICKQESTANEGDIVVALIDQQYATVKRISYKLKNIITLIPANEKLTPQYYESERITIQGIYIGLIRTR